MTDSSVPAFSGAKLALFLGPDLVVIRRDNRPDIPWPDYLDLPGGGREDAETPEACVLREVHEELGLPLNVSDLSWRRFYTDGRTPVWFFAAHLSAACQYDIVFGDEGQGWLLMPPDRFVTHSDAIPHFRDRVRDYLNRAG